MATVTAEAISASGLNATYNAASASDKVLSGDDVFIHVKNAGASPTTVTLVTPRSIEGVAISDPQITVPAGEDRFIGPLSRGLFGNGADSYLATINFSNITSVTFAALTA